MKPAVALAYLYRDADNYKAHGVTVFANPSNRSLDFVRKAINAALSDHILWPDMSHFRPEWVGLPPLFLSLLGYKKTDADLDYHEIVDIVESNELVNDPTGRTIDGFLGDLLKTHRMPSAARRV